VSAGKNHTQTSAIPLHLNTASTNDSDALENHYKALITRGLDASTIQLVVTDMLPAYSRVIEKWFPNALHQFCVFHLMQLLNQVFKQALKEHRHQAFKVGERKKAHQTALLMMKNPEKLNAEERENVLDFCEKYPNVMADYALKEDIRMLYTLSKSAIQAIAYKDILVDQYQLKISVPMEKALKCFTDHFEKSISYLKLGILHAKTNNDAERIMRKIQSNQRVHCYFRKEESLLRHLKIRLGITRVAA
jgi:transposase